MEKEIRPDQVAIYIRWSTEDQGDGTTLAVQSEACRHYLLSQGWQVRDDLIYVDDGHSGGSLDRPALTRLRRAVQAGKVDCVVVFRLDRLSRSVIDTVTLVLQEWADLTHVKSAREPVDTTTAMGRQFFYMLVSYAEWERNVIRERMFSGKLRRAREGRSPGMPAPYGYARGATPGALVPVESEVAAVRLAFTLADQGESVRAIAAHLARQGFPTRKGGPWATSMVSKLLRNPIYAGLMVWGRRRVNPRHGKVSGEPRYRVAAEPHARAEATAIPPLIERDRFDRVQAALAGRRRVAPGAAGSGHLLSGLLRCGACGAPMQYNRFRAWAYYRCGSKSEQAGRCTAPSVPAGVVEDALVALVRRRYEPEVQRQVSALWEACCREQAEQRAAEQASLAGALERLAKQERRINRDYRQGSLTAAERMQLLEQVAAARQALEAGPEAPPGGQPSHCGDLWSCLAAAEQKDLLRTLLEEVRATRREKGLLELWVAWRD
ncbi:MAG TPA: recombinase family protein [Symbiobacteriaceae bacterium]|nr:recombinase family protein [Symbiobacteriaceae bacterium]